MSDRVVPNIICFQTQKQLTTLNNIQVSLKSVLIDLRARENIFACTLVIVRVICRALLHILEEVHLLVG